jgi:hypothetical protein
MKKLILSLLILGSTFSSLSFASDCTLALVLPESMSSLEPQIIDALSDKNYEVQLIQAGEKSSTENYVSWIGPYSAGDIQYKTWQRIHLMTTSGKKVADKFIEMGRLNHKEKSVMKYLKNELESCQDN